MEKPTYRNESLLMRSLARNKVLSRTALALAVGGTLLFNTGCSEEQDSPRTPAPTELSTPDAIVGVTEVATEEELQLICPQEKKLDEVLGDGYAGIAAEYYPGTDWRVAVETGLIENITAENEGRSEFEPELGDIVEVFGSDCGQ